MGIAHNLKKLRNEKGLTQDELSKLLNINRATYAHYETGRREPDLETLKMLAKFFNVSLDELTCNVFDPACGTGNTLINTANYISNNELQKEVNQNPDTTKKLELLIDNKNTHSNIKQISETLAEKFLDLLIDAGEIKSKEDLTTDKVFKILNKIFDQLKEDTK